MSLGVRERRGREGQTLALFALFLVVLMGATALAIDYGSWLKARRDYQNVVDAAALAGSVLLNRPITEQKRDFARAAAWHSIETQLGLTLDEVALGDTSTPVGSPVLSGGWRMWVSTPPLGGPTPYTGAYGGSDRVVFAWIERDNQALLSGVLGQGDRVISGWASAGTFANRFAVITLRKNGQPTNGNPTDLDVNGGTILNVTDGDVGGNWGMSVNGVNSAVVMSSSTGDTYGVYLTENVPTGGNGWTSSQVRTSSGTPVTVQYQAEVVDPMYPAPCVTYGVGAGSGCLEDRTSTYTGSYSVTATRAGDTCPAAGTDVLPPGRYNDLRVANDKCIVLDPRKLPVAGKENGIYYFTGTLDLNNSALVIGDGVTLVFARGADLNMNAGASISLNSGNTTNNPLASACIPNCKYSGWTARSNAGGHYSWSLGASPTYAGPADPFERGIVVYLCKSDPAANCGTGGSASTNILQMNSASGIDYQGLIYAPWDNVKLAGQPTHDDIGQLVAWTAMFTGGTQINQNFDGPDNAVPVLLEPQLGQ